MVHQGPLFLDVLLGQVDGWKDRKQVAEGQALPLPCPRSLGPPVLGTCPQADPTPSLLTIVQLSSWPQNACPEVRCLVWCREKGVQDFLRILHPRYQPALTVLPKL
jgi:hypothetical protein